MSDFKIGDHCLLEPIGWSDEGLFEVVIRGPGYDGYEFTVENVSGRNSHVFHECYSGPMKFETAIGRFVHSRELTLLSKRVREPTKFGKFIRSIEDQKEKVI